jgi:hypothetical protein
MLESLVSSRIRRSLFEHILTHPSDRFYLRGLAKELGVSVSPLRRELKRLAQAGVLKGVQEGNILFYTVDTSSPLFLQLQHAGQSTEAPSEGRFQAASANRPDAGRRTQDAGSAELHPASGVLHPTSNPSVVPIGVISARSVSGWTSPLSAPAMAGVAGAGVALILLAAGLAYLGVANQQLLSQASKALGIRRSDVTVVVPSASPSGAMQSSRWRLVPGGMGGFSSGVSDESY